MNEKLDLVKAKPSAISALCLHYLVRFKASLYSPNICKQTLRRVKNLTPPGQMFN